MATTSEVVQPRRKAAPQYWLDAWRYDWLVIAASTWLIIGASLDAWAHSHFTDTLESFFTPWHGVFYTGFMAVMLVHVIPLYLNVSRGFPFGKALPRGYRLSLIGAAVFMVGGFGDMVWHETFGIEFDIEAALSPTHLLLVGAAILLTTGPLRAAWNRAGNAPTFREILPAALSVTYAVIFASIISLWATLFGTPELIMRSIPSSSAVDAQALVGVLVPNLILMGALLFMIRRWRLPFGVVTLLFTIYTLVFFFVRIDATGDYPALIPAGIAAGLLGDGLLQRLRAANAHVSGVRLYAFAQSLLYFGLLIAALLISGDVRWQIHMWAGVPVICAMLTLMLTYLMWPPAIPAETA